MPGEDESAPASWGEGISRDEINGKLRRYIELRKQLVGVEKSISRVEEEMTAYFDQLATDNVQTDYGILVRRKSGDKFDWIIRL
ncbi:hypothetical protein M1N92_01335 [Dehalococcoidia bacterium]|nr:hypothetical protein [Dehalococcoidia bacterium]